MNKINNYSQYLLRTPQTNHELNLEASHLLHENNLNNLKVLFDTI